MTFCIGIKSKTGVVALADSRISSGLGVSTSKKITTYQNGKYSFFIMSSGLRSIRDKVVHIFEDTFMDDPHDKLYKIADHLGAIIKKVRNEDLKSLKQSNFIFDTHFIIGGQCEHDSVSTLFLVFPEGNWVEVSDESPYTLIGNVGFGKPILRRLLHERISFDMAIKIAYLAFDATFKNASDVDFPIDFALYKNDTYEFKQFRKSEAEMKETADMWNSMLEESAQKLPNFLHMDD